jgi:SAM-dependent methyltransferase
MVERFDKVAGDASQRTQSYSYRGARIYSALGIAGTTYEIGYRKVASVLGDERPGAQYLDFGSGAGRSTAFLVELGVRSVLAVDRDRAMIEHARARSGAPVWLVQASVPLPVRTEILDGAISLHVFIELPTVRLMDSVCAEVFRVLRPGARFVVMSTNPDAFGHHFRTFSYPEPPPHVSGASVECRIHTADGSFSLRDTFWTEQDYRAALTRARFHVRAVSYPAASDPSNWTTSEKDVPPFIVIEAVKPG